MFKCEQEVEVEIVYAMGQAYGALAALLTIHLLEVLG